MSARLFFYPITNPEITLDYNSIFVSCWQYLFAGKLFNHWQQSGVDDNSWVHQWDGVVGHEDVEVIHERYIRFIICEFNTLHLQATCSSCLPAYFRPISHPTLELTCSLIRLPDAIISVAVRPLVFLLYIHINRRFRLYIASSNNALVLLTSISDHTSTKWSH